MSRVKQIFNPLTGQFDLVNAPEQTGVVIFTDTQYTTSNRLSGTGGTPLALPNNKGVVNNVSAPSLGINWIDNTGVITPDSANGDSYIARITFTIQATLNNRNLDISLNTGTVIWQQTERLARGAANVTNISAVIPFNSDSNFSTNGGVINVEVDGDFEIFDIVYYIEKVKQA